MMFWDSSAIVPLVVDEPLTKVSLEKLGMDVSIVVWTFTSVEVTSALQRSFREGRIDRAALDAALSRLDELIGHAYIVESIDRVKNRAQIGRAHV